MFDLSSSTTEPDLIVHSAKPLNAEPPLDRLRSAFVTKTGDFYVRSHGDMPEIDPVGHKLTVPGLVGTPWSYRWPNSRRAASRGP